MRLFLGLPTGGSPAPPFLESLTHLELPVQTQAFVRGIVTGNFVPAQRDLLVEQALVWNADVIVMCDDDMILPANTLRLLIDALLGDERVAIAGALYYSRDGLRPMVVDGWEPHDTSLGWIPAFDDRTPVAVAGVGFGCVAIRSSAIAEFARPFFASQIYVERSAGRVRVCNEDYLFCRRVRDAGHVVLLHPAVRCGHYDRARNAVAPAAWEPAARTGVKRILVRTGEAYALVPLESATENTSPEIHVSADVVYVETP